jgi:hypothetical protein
MNDILSILRDHGMLLLVGQYPHGPLGGLAITFVLSVLRLLLALPLGVTHEMNFAREVADKVWFLEQEGGRGGRGEGGCGTRLSGAHPRVARWLQDVQAKGTEDVRLLLNAKGGAVYASLTASGAMMRAVAENVPGDNIVTTVLEHPSAYDAASFYAQRLGKELRVAPSNPETGGIDVDEIVQLIDKRTCVLSLICELRLLDWRPLQRRH